MNNLKTIVLATALTTLLAACNNDGNKTAGTSDSTTTAMNNESHQHAYRCPMNCEKGKTYEKPGKCPVCGMNLEHYDGGEDNGFTYKMQYASNPGELTAGEAATLSFTPKVVGKEAESVALDLQHEKKIHLIVASDDLSYFEHIHPEYQSDGSYQIKVLANGQNYSNGAGKSETKFANGGKYVLFADYKPTGGAHQVEKVPFTLKGTTKPQVTFKGDKLSGTSDAYTVSLNVDGGKLVTGTPLHIAGTISKDGKAVDASTLENYLGAKAHMVVLSLNEKEYLHVHPDVVAGKLDVNTTFKKPGIYRGWIQFNGDGKIHTVDFTMNVSQGSGDNAEKATEAKNATN